MQRRKSRISHARLVSCAERKGFVRGEETTENDQRGKTMLKKRVFIALTALLAIGVFGCANGNFSNPLGPEESQLDKNWGRSFEAAKHNQILNPEAEKNLKPVEGLQGPVAERIMDGYTKSGEKKQEPPSEFGVVTIKK